MGLPPVWQCLRGLRYGRMWASRCSRRWRGGRVELVEFVLCSGEADLESFDLAEPAFTVGFSDAGVEVVADLFQPWPLGGVGLEQGTSDTCFSELKMIMNLVP